MAQDRKPQEKAVAVVGPDKRVYAELALTYTLYGRDLAGWLVRQGHALAYRKYSTKYVPQEDQAKAAQAGVWAGEFVPPWDWRRGARLD